MNEEKDFKGIKLTGALRKKHEKNLKGKVYLFIVAANELAFAGGYKYQKTDTGAKDAQAWINGKIESLTSLDKGPYWKDDYAGFEKIYSAAKQAKSDIVEEKYTNSVGDFLDTVLASHIPKGEKPKSEPKILSSEEIDRPVKFLERGVTGRDLKKNKLREEELASDLSEIGDLAAFLDEEEGEISDDELAELEERDDTDYSELL